MPIYEYQCQKCQQILEVQQSFSEQALTICPDCQGKLQKVISAPRVIFKGKGFYKTDHSSASRKSSSKTSQPAGSKEESVKGAKTTDKPVFDAKPDKVDKDIKKPA